MRQIIVVRLVSDSGEPLDATFSVEDATEERLVILESRGPDRNLDYKEGLQTLLERLGDLNAVLVDAYLDTVETRRQELTRPQRRLSLHEGATYPHALRRASAADLTATLKASQRAIGQPPGASGGNDTRRMVMEVQPGQDPFPPLLEPVLAGSPRVGIVYVPASRRSADNLKIGLDVGVWGFSKEAMARSSYLRDFRLLREGDMVFLGHRGPSPRVAAGGWSDKHVEVGHVGLITGVDESATDAVWPDGVYPYRLYVDFAAERRGFGAADLGAEVMEALRLSANQQGRAVVLPLGRQLLAGEVGGATAPLGLDGPLDRMVARAERREQAALRKQRLGGADSAACDLCGRSFPVRYLRMAHIKKRSLCSDREKRDPSVVMTACVECDALFEAGELVVDASGKIRATGTADVTPDLKTLLDHRVGKACAAFSDDTSGYFEFHHSAFA